MATSENMGRNMKEKLESLLKLTPREEKEAEKERKNFEKGAEKDLQKMCAQNPIRPFFKQNFIGKRVASFFENLYLNRASYCFQNENHNKAPKYLERAFRWNPNSAAAWYGMALISRSKDAYLRMIRELTCVLHLMPENVEALMMRSSVFQMKKKYVAALADLFTCIRLDMKNAELWYLAGTLYWRMDENKKAIQFLTQSTLLAPLDIHMWQLLALNYEEMDNNESAYSCYRIIMALQEAQFGKDFTKTLNLATQEIPILQEMQAACLPIETEARTENGNGTDT
ncbi:MAG: hypothetical protein Q4C70_15590, partial [Planctomycetia bacterium]|nr:hypothetical protein [Planctomycetia bacterium]